MANCGTTAPLNIETVMHRNTNLRKRFYAKVEPIPEGDGCWEWTGSLAGKGYGYFSVLGVPRLAHRVAYVLFYGEVPDGLHIDHVCRNKSCVNPQHLEAVTLRENNIRANQKLCRNRLHTKTQENTQLYTVNDKHRGLYTFQRCVPCYKYNLKVTAARRKARRAGGG